VPEWDDTFSSTARGGLGSRHLSFEKSYAADPGGARCGSSSDALASAEVSGSFVLTGGKGRSPLCLERRRN
jgi:hypothetical protein